MPATGLQPAAASSPEPPQAAALRPPNLPRPSVSVFKAGGRGPAGAAQARRAGGSAVPAAMEVGAAGFERRLPRLRGRVRRAAFLGEPPLGRKGERPPGPAR